MGSLAAVRLRERGVGRLLVASRTFANAQALAARVGGEALAWEWRYSALHEVAGVVCAVRSETPVLSVDGVAEATAGRASALVIVDLAVPRNVEGHAVRYRLVRLADVATLGDELRGDAERRAGAVSEAEAIVSAELGSWVEWANGRPGDAPRSAVVAQTDTAR
jgi:glutamyl-tRNA reductase